MRVAKQKEGNYTLRKPKTLIIAAKKAPFPKLILNSVLLLSKRNRSSQADRRTRPIHTTSTHCQTAKQRYITEASDINEPYELSVSQRQLKGRIKNRNQFNRRTFQEEASPTKKSLYFRNLRKCKSNLTKLDFEVAIQEAVGKKKIATKEESRRESQFFWDSLKDKLEDEEKVGKRIQEGKKIVGSKLKLKTEYNKIINEGITALSIKKYDKRHHQNLHKSKRATVFDEAVEVRPWSNMKRQQLAMQSSHRGNSSGSRMWIEQQY